MELSGHWQHRSSDSFLQLQILCFKELHGPGSVGRHVANSVSLWDIWARENRLRRLIHTIAFVSLITCWPIVAPAQGVRPDSTEVLKQLLAAPAPTPQTAETAAEDQKTIRRNRLFFDSSKVPPDDAPIADLVDYWTMWANNYRSPDPSPTVVGRLLDASSTNPQLLPGLLGALPENEPTAARVKELYERALTEQQMGGEGLQTVKRWLVYNSNYFTNELQALANKVRDNEKGYIDQEGALVALAKVDWSAAEPIVQSLINGSQPRSATLALGLLYNHAIDAKDLTAEEKLRGQLQTIAGDRSAPASTRNAAIDTLSLSEWSGRDEWYLSFFHDETLLESTDGIYAYSLGTPLLKDPDKWIPVLAKMMESTDKTVRSAAASCLILFQNSTARADALRPLVPWLSNPDWVKDRFNQRLGLIQSLRVVNLPESVPGLIWIVEHNTDDILSEQSYAAQALGRYKDPRAIPALKKALATEEHETDRRLIIEGLFACGGFLESELVEALEVYATKLAEAGDGDGVNRARPYTQETLPLPLSIGDFLSQSREAPEGLLRAVLARADVLKKSNPVVAKSLLEVVHGWQGLQVDLDVVHRLADGSADADTIRKALERREKLRESVKAELQALSGGAELAQGMAAVLLEDAALAQSVLSSGSELTQIALLACARLEQFPLPVNVVGQRLQSKNQLLARAAESYLLAEDSKEARELLWAHHPNEAFVTGWRENASMLSGNKLDELAKFEEKLRAELFKENPPPVETIALFSNDLNNGCVLRVYADRAVYTQYENAARYRDRVITKEELAAFRDFIATGDFANHGPQLTYCHYDCAMSELLLITREKGRRVFSNDGDFAEEALTTNLHRLGLGDNAKIHYNLEKEIKGLEVLFADEQLIVKDVWQGETGIRIFVEQPAKSEDENEATGRDQSEMEEDEAMREERRRREIAREEARFSWRALANGKAGAVFAAPAEFSKYDENKFPDNEELSGGDVRSSQFVAPDSLIIAGKYEGLWRQVAGQKPVKISDQGGYGNPIVTPDAKWIVVAKSDNNWGGPNYIVRFNLQTGREFRVNLPEADEFLPIAYVAPHGRVLLRRDRGEDEPSIKSLGPDKPEYYLLDAATGRTELVAGVFEPLRQDGNRLLQPTGKPNEFWAAIPNPDGNQTHVGRYNLKDFSFQPVLLVPHITFDSMSLWVDGTAGKLLIVYEGQLLRLPLPRAAEDATAPKQAGSKPN